MIGLLTININFMGFGLLKGNGFTLNKANELINDPNADGNRLISGLSELEKMGSLAQKSKGFKSSFSLKLEKVRNDLIDRYKNRLLTNTQTASQQELARQTTFAGANMQMQTERKRLLGV